MAPKEGRGSQDRRTMKELALQRLAVRRPDWVGKVSASIRRFLLQTRTPKAASPVGMQPEVKLKMTRGAASYTVRTPHARPKAAFPVGAQPEAMRPVLARATKRGKDGRKSRWKVKAATLPLDSPGWIGQFIKVCSPKSRRHPRLMRDHHMDRGHKWWHRPKTSRKTPTRGEPQQEQWLRWMGHLRLRTSRRFIP